MTPDLDTADRTVRDYLDSSNNGFTRNLVLSIALAGAGLLALNYMRKNKSYPHTSDDAAPWAVRGRKKTNQGVLAGKTVLINRPPQEVYAFWRDFTNLQKFMENIESVEAEGKRSKWQVAAPAGRSVYIESVLTEEKENQLLAWESTENSQVKCKGKVTFTPAPGNRGTRVQAEILYKPPGGELGRAIAHMFRKAPEVQARHDLKRLKMLMETGEIATSKRAKTA